MISFFLNISLPRTRRRLFCMSHFLIFRFCSYLFLSFFFHVKRPPPWFGEVFILFLLFFAYVPCFIGFELGITDFQMMEIFFRFSDYDTGEA